MITNRAPAKNARKRPFGATVRTLDDIGGDRVGGENDASASPNVGKITVQHIPSLPNDDGAARMLRRIHSEFAAIIERRGWDVASITEMCCCGDGVDCHRKKKRGSGARSRRRRTMPDNVLGYNRTSYRGGGGGGGGKVHDIHLRLRHPRTHALLDYDSVAGTMCHELAHCVRGPHDAAFYGAMEEIEEQYAVYLARGVVLDRDGFPVGSAEAHVLGGGGGQSGGGAAVAERRRRARLEAAERRRRGPGGGSGLTSGYVLGGGAARGRPRDPRDAAREAAERRLLDSKYCLPCNEIIEILGEDSSDEVGSDDDNEIEVVEAGSVAKANVAGKKGRRNTGDDDGDTDLKPKAKDDATTPPSNDGLIDLTADDSFAASPPVGELQSANVPKRNARPRPSWSEWTCPRCTLSNSGDVLACDACYLERPSSKTILERARALGAEDDVERVRRREAEESREAFGGFNIYGEKRTPSLTMKHLT